jgi:4-carboxymuconolactone decarboxylase
MRQLDSHRRGVMMKINVEGLSVFAELRGTDRAEQMHQLAQGVGAEAAIAELSLDFVFGKVWSRGGLERKQRSLITIGILIALRQTEEMKNHVRAGLRNGLTLDEIHEAVVHAAPYAGFPAAWAAAIALRDIDADEQSEITLEKI